MKPQDFGYNDELEKLRIENNLQDFEIGRVIAEHKERYIVKTEKGDVDAEITGNLSYSAAGREDFPAVGDWVALSIFDSGTAIIHKVLPRFSVISRPAVGQHGQIQLIATNVDYAFLVQAVDRDFNLNRLERYLNICYSSGVEPLIVLTKTDLIDEHRLSELTDSVTQRIKSVPVLAVSNETQSGYPALAASIKKGKNYCFLGSSGVGKSSLVNNLSGRSKMKTAAISDSTQKGKHITTHRELVVLENGGILIDNPGMREVGVADSGQGLETTFDNIIRYARNCKFVDCTHTSELGCAVREALEEGEIDQDAYDNYQRMQREKAHFESTVAERRKKEKKFGKFMKDFKKNRGKSNY